MSSPVAAPTATPDFLDLARKSGLLDEPRFRDRFPDLGELPPDAVRAAAALVKANLLTAFQAKQLLAGRYRGFLLGAYRILEPLGKGGMGTVYLAEHTSLRRKVALKVLPSNKANDKLTLERFHREARAVAAVDHPNIVRLHDISQGNGVHFLVMEYVDGTDLQSLMAKTGPLHFAQAVHYVAQAAAGLQHAHDRGIIHRDIKPGNLMLTREGTIKILDLGLARSVMNPADQLTASLGDDSEVAGTADYISPEQAMNKVVDERSDIYSLGITLFSLVTGHPPFQGSTAQKLMQHQLAEPPSLTKLRGVIPPALSQVVAKMMAKKPSDRYRTAADVIDALGPWLPAPTSGNIVHDQLNTADMRVQSPTASLSDESAEAAPARRSRMPLIIGSVVGAVVLIGGVTAAALMLGEKKESKQVVQAPAPSPAPAIPTPAPKPVATPPAAVNPPSAPIEPTTPPAPPAPATKGALYQTAFEQVPPFRARVKWGYTAVEGEIPLLPTGWRLEVWDKESLGDFQARFEQGQTVMLISPAEGKNATQLVFDPQKAPGVTLEPNTSYKVRLEYRVDPGIEGLLAVQEMGGGWKQLSRTSLKPGAGGWQTVDVVFTAPEKIPLQFTIGSQMMQPGKWVAIRRFELLPANGSAVPTAVVPPPPAPMPVVPAVEVFKIDLTSVMPFRTTIQERKPVNDPEWARRMPAGVGLHCWKDESVAEFVAEGTDRGPALGITNLNDTNSAQMLIFPDTKEKPLQADREYRVKIEYRTMSDAHGFLSVRGANYQGIAKADLPATGGEWRMAETTFRRPVDHAVDFDVENQAVGEGNTLFVRSVVVTEVAP